jgi:hypothetical protein
MIRGAYFCFPYPKDPDETLDYQFDWTQFIDTDTIAISPEGRVYLIEFEERGWAIEPEDRVFEVCD